jgi:hypothetical protein
MVLILCGLFVEPHKMIGELPAVHKTNGASEHLLIVRFMKRY